MLRQSVEFALTAVVRVNDGGGAGASRIIRHGQRVVHECRLAAPINRPADDATSKEVEHCAAVDLALARGVFRDIGQPELVGSIGREIALDEVLFGRRVHQVLLVPLGPR